MTSSIGMMKFPIFLGKFQIDGNQTTNQIPYIEDMGIVRFCPSLDRHFTTDFHRKGSGDLTTDRRPATCRARHHGRSIGRPSVKQSWLSKNTIFVANLCLWKMFNCHVCWRVKKICPHSGKLRTACLRCSVPGF